MIDLSSLNVERKSSDKRKVFLNNFKYFIEGTTAKLRAKLRKHPLVTYSLRRLLNSIITILLASATILLLLRLVPDKNYVTVDLDKFSPEIQAYIIEQTRIKYGLNKNVFIQILEFYKDIAFFIPKTACVLDSYDAETGKYVCEQTKTVFINFQTSLRLSQGTPALNYIFSRMPQSLTIALPAFVLTYIIGVPLGILMGKNKGKKIDRFGNVYVIIARALPSVLIISFFWLIGMLFKTGAFYSINRPVTWIVPIICVVFLNARNVMNLTRRYIVDESNSDYTKFARSKGVSENKVFFVHVFRNAGIRTIASIPLDLVMTMLGVGILIERQWTVSGIGMVPFDAATNYDIPVILGFTVISACFIVVGNLAQDLLLAFLDPRIKLVK